MLHCWSAPRRAVPSAEEVVEEWRLASTLPGTGGLEERKYDRWLRARLDAVAGTDRAELLETRGNHLAAWNSYDEAADCFREAHNIRRATFGAEHDATLTALVRLSVTLSLASPR